MGLTPRRLFSAIFFVALFVMATREISDPDFWWHLRTGQYIVESASIPHVDIFSFTRGGQPWITHEWLSEVLIFLVYRLGGFPVLIVAFAAIIALSFWLAFTRCVGRPYVAALALFLGAVATAPAWGVRPQMLSLLLTSAYLWILDNKDSRKTSRRIWILIPLMLLWVNLHSGYALGLALVGVYWFGEAVSDLRNLKSRLLDIHSPLGRLSIVLLLCIAVVPLNPNGASMYIYPFDTLGSRAMQAFIQEWFSPDFHLPEWQPFAWLLLATLGAVSLSGKRLSLTQALLLVGLGYASLRSVRIIPLFALVAAPVLSEQLWTILSSRSWFSAPKESRLTRGTALLNWIVLLLILVAGLARVSSVIGNQATVEMDKFPTAAASFLNSKPNTGALYNAYAWGGYLIWRLYPQQRVFIDGRADVYGDAFVEEFLQAWRGGTGWQAPLEKYGIRTILIESDAPLATQLARDASWRQVYTDRQATIFQRN